MKKLIVIVIMVAFVVPAFAVTDAEFEKERTARLNAEYQRVQFEAATYALQARVKELESKQTGTEKKK